MRRHPDATDTDDDDDGLTDIEEAEIGTNPLDADTDQDTVNDAMTPSHYMLPRLSMSMAMAYPTRGMWDVM